jgi:hypothetical protein
LHSWADASFKPQASDIENWSSPETVYFLERLVENSPSGVSVAQLEEMDSAYKFSATGNSEIRMRWCSLLVASKHSGAYDQVVKFLADQGRMKFVRPLYRALFTSGDAGKQGRLFVSESESAAHLQNAAGGAGLQMLCILVD